MEEACGEAVPSVLFVYIARSGRPKKRPMLLIIGLRMFARAVCPPYVDEPATDVRRTDRASKHA